MTEHHVPEGMKAWGPDSEGYPDAPADWGGGPVWFRYGQASFSQGLMPWRWGHENAPGDIIAYTPLAASPTPDTPVADQGMEDRAREVLTRYTVGKDSIQAVEGGGSCYHPTARVVAAMIAFATTARADGEREGRERAAKVAFAAVMKGGLGIEHAQRVATAIRSTGEQP